MRELLKIKADFCLLLEDWDCDATFKNTYTLLTDADGELRIDTKDVCNSDRLTV